ncbi:MAG TPA: hypothetical protein VFZ65_15980 [Planctomycetota bacterium]|nr:hypothetical protein [Planctomycetota bacterium]
MITLPSFAAMLLASLPLALPFLHPHVPKAIVVQGAGGKATLTWFTVPYNKDQVATLPNGAEWHLGFATLDVAMPLAAGKTVVPVAKYKLNVLRDGQGEFSKFVLIPTELIAARRAPRGQQPDQAKVDAVKKDLASRSIPERLELEAAKSAGKDAEHLDFAILTRGFEAVERGSANPKGGVSFALFADFGDLHRTLELVEQFGDGANSDSGK